MIGDRWNWKANFHFHLEMSQRFWQRAKLESPVFNQVYQVDQSFASARHPQRVINRYVLVTFITFTANDDVALRAFRSSLFNSMPRSIHRSGANIKLEFFFVSVEKKINFQYSNFSRFQIFFPSFWNHYYYLYRYNIGWNYWDKLVKKKRVKARKERERRGSELGDPGTVCTFSLCWHEGGIPSGKSTVSGMPAWRLSRNRLSTICDRNL